MIIDNTILNYFNRSMAEKKYKPIGQPFAIGSALALASLPMAVAAYMKAPYKKMIPRSIAAGIIGYAIPTIVDKALTIDDKEEREAYLMQQAMKAGFVESLAKEASYAAFGGFAGKAIKMGAGLVKDFGRGLKMPIKGNKTIGETALSVGSKGIAAYGVYKAGDAIIQRSKQPNYVNYLRNQVLAGNIKPEEMTESDLTAVRKLGV